VFFLNLNRFDPILIGDFDKGNFIFHYADLNKVVIMKIKLGKYRHYKGKVYESIGIARDSETFKDLKYFGIYAKRAYYFQRGYFWLAGKIVRTKIMQKLGFARFEKLFLSMSHECNANCVHCYEKFACKKEGVSLKTEKAKSLIDEFEKMGGCIVYFCAGEFLMRKDCFELINYTRSKGLAAIVITNGLLLSEERVVALKNAGLTMLIVSLDSPVAAEHDRLRGVKGCFEKAINGLKFAQKHKILTQIWTYTTKSHENDLNGLAKIGRDVGVQLVFVYFTLLSGKLFDKPEENLSEKDKAVLRKKFNHVFPISLQFPTKNWACHGMGKEHINVMPSGEVTFCPPVPYSYGNVHERSLKSIYLDLVRDAKRFYHLRGQCPVNFQEYREKCNAKFIYGDKDNVK